MGGKPEYRYEVRRAQYPGWLKHLWWCRDDHGRGWACTSTCGRPKQLFLFPAYAPKPQSELDAARELIELDPEDACAVCRKRAVGILKRAETANV